MFLKRLTVSDGDVEIRSIPFQKGLNLIVDVTPKVAQASGNNIGKTTALRCIDFCLDADPKSLYLDREWRTPNQRVLDFLERKRPVFSLEFEDVDGRTHMVERQYGVSQRVIDGEAVSGADAPKRLRDLLFRVSGKKPTFRQLIGKFVRLSLEAKHNTIKWLHPTTSDADYDVIWLSLFGFANTELLNERRTLQKDLKGLNVRKKEIEAVAKSPRQARNILQRDLEKAQKALDDLAIADAQERDLDALASVRASVMSLSQKLAVADGHVHNGRRTLALLERAGPSVPPDTIKEVFDDAHRYNPEMHTEFTKLVEFHDAMLKNKATFTKRRIGKWETQARALRKELREASDREAVLLRSLSSPDALEDVRRLNAEVMRLSGELGYLQGLESELSKIQRASQKKRQRITEIELSIEEEKEALDENLVRFNEHFSDYSRRLYGVGYYLDLPWEQNAKGTQRVVPKIGRLESHSGSGKKRQEIAAFDLAYLKWQEDRHAKTIRFTLHDEAELIYKNQLATLFEITQSLDGQIVLPVLSDKLETVPFEGIQDCVVLELSEQQKFFRLP